MERKRAGRNRTIVLTPEEIARYRGELLRLEGPARVKELLGRVVHQDLFAALPFLPEGFVDLLFIDPPYNLDKRYNRRRFGKTSLAAYEDWLESWMEGLKKILKPTASIYICSEWRSSPAVRNVVERHFRVRNRITWEREKGRGSRSNWKMCSEDIWFCTVSDRYTFNVDAVKLRRKVLAPYTLENRQPKDWRKSKEGRYRLTHPSNLWTDICVPFWSMPENTDHPTQKPEKLLAKIILASSRPGDVVFDPFLGSGAACVAAKKLGRRFVGVEIDETYACLALKRLEAAETNKDIQGYYDGVFQERNAKPPGKVREHLT